MSIQLPNLSFSLKEGGAVRLCKNGSGRITGNVPFLKMLQWHMPKQGMAISLPALSDSQLKGMPLKDNPADILKSMLIDTSKHASLNKLSLNKDKGLDALKEFLACFNLSKQEIDKLTAGLGGGDSKAPKDISLHEVLAKLVDAPAILKEKNKYDLAEPDVQALEVILQQLGVSAVKVQEMLRHTEHGKEKVDLGQLTKELKSILEHINKNDASADMGEASPTITWDVIKERLISQSNLKDLANEIDFKSEERPNIEKFVQCLDSLLHRRSEKSAPSSEMENAIARVMANIEEDKQDVTGGALKARTNKKMLDDLFGNNNKQEGQDGGKIVPKPEIVRKREDIQLQVDQDVRHSRNKVEANRDFPGNKTEGNTINTGKFFQHLVEEKDLLSDSSREKGKQALPDYAMSSERANVLVETAKGSEEVLKMAPKGMPSPMVEYVGKQIADALSKSQPEITIRLHPPELGAIKVKMVMQDNGLTLDISAQRDDTRALLAAHTQDLKDSLGNYGIRLEQMDVHDGFQFNGGMTDMREGYNGHGQDTSEHNGMRKDEYFNDQESEEQQGFFYRRNDEAMIDLVA